MYKAIVRNWNEDLVAVFGDTVHELFTETNRTAKLEARNENGKFVYADFYDPYGNMFMAGIYYYNGLSVDYYLERAF